MKLRKSRLQILKRLALYANKTPVEVKLDRFWGFKAEKPKRKKTRNKRLLYESQTHPSATADIDDVFASIDNNQEQDSDADAPIEVQPVDKSIPNRRKPWEPDPEVKKQKEAFKNAVKEIRNLVYPHLDSIAKRQYDNAKLVALGGKVAKNRKMPYNEFLQRSRALKRNIEKKQRLEKELGVKCFFETKGGARFAEIEKK
eukprot:XP_001609427.1 hypothetical protein [Babesia bovis T2Bo]